MHWIDYIIVLVPLCFVFGLAFYSKRYVRGVADFLAAGRVAGRYVISVGDMSAAMSIITVISLVESQYQSGLGITFWNNLLIPVTIFLSLTGFVLYRYRQTRSLSLGQFLEMRYNRPFRIIAAALRTVSEAMANTIGPAVAARFFIYMLGIPMTFTIGGIELQTFPAVMFFLLVLALMLIWPGGRISLLVTDALQGLM
ncbi:MAG: sodium:panthothenate symporter, partial [Lentisphaeria bacterium]|nr:sodium:panthothenate symporter [Lentisphaeria bacterium]